MNRDKLLKELAVTGYNVLYAGKKHFATFDIVEKVPGWITVATLGIGIFALITPELNNKYFAAAVLVVGIASIYFNQFQLQGDKYATTGNVLIGHYNALRGIYNHAQSRDISADVDDLEAKYMDVLGQSERVWKHRHIFLSDWYAHYKIFGQAQIGWLDEQLHFKFWRDKMPLTLSATLVVAFVAAAYLAVSNIFERFSVVC